MSSAEPRELLDVFARIGFDEALYRFRGHTRIAQIQHLLDTHQIDGEFFWTDRVVSTGGSVVTACRSCGDERLHPVLDLGSTPIANALVDPADAGRPDPVFPLDIVFCPQCSLVQLGYALPADASSTRSTRTSRRSPTR